MLSASFAFGQGVTTANMQGSVLDEQVNPCSEPTL